ncbi:acyl-CoA N-acyltransferase [Echria macrotheca]|uniref:Acyl-CoA N-acyltransferase n=1 Tax=Echria macrotheca TaxID=438768 RepID=A0AAJ0B825_9PEZI|nr:acyl-CoA N-acyltransferase [Echria macrotheca]
MASPRLAEFASSSEPILKLPHPHLTAYGVVSVDNGFRLRQLDGKPRGLDNESLVFSEPTDLKSSDRPHESNNTPWGRARRAPFVSVTYKTPATVAQLWLLSYIIFTVRPAEEAFRLSLSGPNSSRLLQQLQTVGLAIAHPRDTSSTQTNTDELLVLRGAFWQGAGSPFGPRPVWAPETQDPDLTSFPPLPPNYIMTSDPSTALCWHPRRRSKPQPGSVLYSRYIPHLRETFSMIALDWQDPSHLDLFHAWQNDPRVSQGWNETGTLDQHREYLRKAHEDPHQITILARFDDTPFAYFEVYWAKEDRIGAYYAADDFDRGRHSLVGDVRYRGPHRVSAWWSSLMHYLFLDEPRTATVVGEPKFTNSSVLMYDLMHGFGLNKFIDLPHKRSALVMCSRERFFQLCPLHESEKVMGGTSVGLVPKL